MHSSRVRAALTRSLWNNRIGDAGACGIGKGLASNTALQEAKVRGMPLPSAC